MSGVNGELAIRLTLVGSELREHFLYEMLLHCRIEEVQSLSG
jgi:hypothetical protein